MSIFFPRKAEQILPLGQNLPCIFIQFLLSVAAAPVTASLIIRKNGYRRRAKFGGGETHGTENAARILGFVAGAFLIRNAVFRGADKILSRALDSDHGEEAERNEEFCAVLRVAKSALKIIGNSVGKIIHTGAAVALAYRLYDLGGKNYRIDRFKDCDRKICRSGAAASLGSRAKSRASFFTSVNIHIPFASEEDKSLFHYSEAVKCLNVAGTDASLTCYFDVYLYRKLIKSAVSIYAQRIDADFARTAHVFSIIS